MSAPVAPKKPIRHLRWWIGGLLFFVTVINYIDRQTLGANSIVLKQEYGWSNTDYSWIVNAFQISYTIMQSVVGRLLDVLGTRAGVGGSVAFYSLIGALTAGAGGFYSFCTFRFLLGAGEAANNPGGAKAVSEWFPAKERAAAVAIFNSGCAIGGALAPWLAYGVWAYFHSWRPAFLITGCLGLLWLVAWLKLYHAPEKHPRLSPEELDYIQKGRSSSTADADAPKVTWRKVLGYRQTWGLILGRFLLDPFWFLITNWYALYLESRGFSLKQSMLGSAIPLLCAALGNYFAGGLSSYWVHRGWEPGKSRRTILLIFGPSMALILLSSYVNSYAGLVLIFTYATFAYTCCGTMFLTLPTDVFHTRAVGTVMGLAGTSAGISTLITTLIIGKVSDAYGFGPVILAAAFIPAIATVVFVTMVRAGKKPDPEGILLKF